MRRLLHFLLQLFFEIFFASVYLSIYIYLWLCSPLLDLGLYFQFLDLQSRYDSLDGGSVLRKAATYTQNNTNTE
jgi:hypothetical protein